MIYLFPSVCLSHYLIMLMAYLINAYCSFNIFALSQYWAWYICNSYFFSWANSKNSQSTIFLCQDQPVIANMIAGVSWRLTKKLELVFKSMKDISLLQHIRCQVNSMENLISVSLSLPNSQEKKIWLMNLYR